MAHIYIAFVDTPGFFAFLIRKFIKQRYVHVVISGDADLTEAYSVGRRIPAVPVIAGFEKEDKVKILRVFPTAFYRVCKLPCTVEQRKKIMERLRTDYRRRFRIHYAVCGLLFLVLGIPFYQKDHYTCSSYVARVLSENGISVSQKHFSLVTPKDFSECSGMQQIFEGPLSEMVSVGLNFAWEGVSAYGKG